MTDTAERNDIEYHVVPIDNSTSLLETLRNDPTALPSCNFHEGHMADSVYLIPPDDENNQPARVEAWCGQHIIKGEGYGIALLDITGFRVEYSRDVLPLITRDELTYLDEILARIGSGNGLFDDDPSFGRQQFEKAGTTAPVDEMTSKTTKAASSVLVTERGILRNFIAWFRKL